VISSLSLDAGAAAGKRAAGRAAFDPCLGQQRPGSRADPLRKD